MKITKEMLLNEFYKEILEAPMMSNIKEMLMYSDGEDFDEGYLSDELNRLVRVMGIVKGYWEGGKEVISSIPDDVMERMNDPEKCWRVASAHAAFSSWAYDWAVTDSARKAASVISRDVIDRCIKRVQRDGAEK